jgi:hypothetical protein
MGGNWFKFNKDIQHLLTPRFASYIRFVQPEHKTTMPFLVQLSVLAKALSNLSI